MAKRHAHSTRNREVRGHIANADYFAAAEELLKGVRKKPADLAIRSITLVGAMLDDGWDRQDVSDILDRLLTELESF